MTYFVLPGRKGKQYLAIATLVGTLESSKIGLCRAGPASIQLWSLSPSNNLAGKLSPKATCESVLCIDEGSALQIKWCPLPSHDSASYLYIFEIYTNIKGQGKPGAQKSMGVLAAVTTDGTVGIYKVPETNIQKKGVTGPSYGER